MSFTKDEFRNAKQELGMSASQLAKTLRMGRRADRTIRRYESGETPVPGPVSVAIEALLTGFRPADYEEQNEQ